MPYRTTPIRYASLLAAAVLAAGAAFADDRGVLQDSGGSPYVFVVLDSSGSMSWTPPCTELDAAIDIDPWDGACTRECTMDPTVCAQFDPGTPGLASDWDPADPDAVKCIEFSVSYDDGANLPPTVEIILDEESAPVAADGTIDILGTWTSASATAPFVGSQYRHNNMTGQGTNSARFTPDLPHEGYYHVYLSYNGDANSASNVPLTIQHANGTAQMFIDQRKVDQREPTLDSDPTDPQFYNYIGTWWFHAGNAGNVLIETDNTIGLVNVDAVRFASVERPATLSCLQTGYRYRQPLCPRGDCSAPANGDDPIAKNFQAREALYEVLNDAEDVLWGFGTYEQDNLRLRAKHWLYRVPELDSSNSRQSFFTEFNPDLPEFPVPESYLVFGNGPEDYDGNGLMDDDGFDCASASSYTGDTEFDGTTLDLEGVANQVACFVNEPADTDDLWEMERASRFPLLGIDQDVDTVLYYRDPNDTSNANFPDGQVYRLTYEPVSGSYGDATITVELTIQSCNDAACSGPYAFDQDENFELALVTDYVAWDDDSGRFPMRTNGFFHDERNGRAQDLKDCFGLEPNNDTDTSIVFFDTDDDEYRGYTPKWPTEPDFPLFRGEWLEFWVGDFVPFDWLDNHRDELLGRMAPNLIDPTTGRFDDGRGAPDFRVATYFADTYNAADEKDIWDRRKLRLKEEEQRVVVPNGSTPIAASLEDFAQYYFGNSDWDEPFGWAWDPDGFIGDADLAGADDEFACREKYVLFLTDGNETCDSDPDAPGDAAAALLGSDPDNPIISTYVVGFGLAADEQTLDDIAIKGGTGAPILPRNQAELIEELQSILSEIRPETRTFAAASIPAAQSSTADKLYLSSFVPQTATSFSPSIWPGRLDAYRKPLPLTPDNLPDVDRMCTDASPVSCHLWEAGDVILGQSPTDDEIDLADEYSIGPDRLERRIFYPQANPSDTHPSQLMLFRPPPLEASGDPKYLADVIDLAEVIDPDALIRWGIDGDDEALALEVTDEIIKVIRRKQLDDDSADLIGNDEFIMADIFHSQPLVINSPDDLRYFADDLCGRIQPDDIPNNCVSGEDRGYRFFTQENAWRRRQLVVGTNDGQLHVLDGGIRETGEEELPDGQRRDFEVFNDGDGFELFSYMPRLTLPVMREQINGANHIYSLDGTLTVRDVFIDPAHDPTLDPVNPDHREWRTVLMSGLRSGGTAFGSSATIPDFYSGYFALDLTQPDDLVRRTGDSGTTPDETLIPDDSAPFEEQKLPSCLDFAYGDTDDGAQQVVSGCTSRDGNGIAYPYPMELWTFTDAVENHLIGPPFFDEDANGVRDLGDTWSQPVIGQITVCEVGGTLCDPDDPAANDDLTVLHVAIFGGGLDPDNKAAPERGTWLYMVDIETGEAVYKKLLDGAAPASPTVIDRDNDGIFDAIYIGTTNGSLYKVDLDGRASGSNLPRLESTTALDTDGNNQNVLRINDNNAWDPFTILVTENNAPIYLSATAFRIPDTDRIGLAVGTGDRHDLWDKDLREGRFYVIADQDNETEDEIKRAGALSSGSEACETRLPIEEACLTSLAFDSDPSTVTSTSTELENPNLLVDSDDMDNLQPGWVMTFPVEHRLTARPFLLASVLVFSVLEPEISEATGGSGTVVCSRSGVTRSFVVQVQNANPLARLSAVDQGTGGGTSPSSGALKGSDRFLATDDLATPPFVDPPTPHEASVDSAEELSDSSVEDAVREAIMGSFPRGSRFNPAITIPIRALLSTTGVVTYVSIPVAVAPADWREPIR